MTCCKPTSNGRLKKGSNEVTKTAERGTAQFIVLAVDVNPPELLAHIPLICEEKGIPYGYVPSQEYLAKEAGLPDGVKTASIAVMEITKGAQEKFTQVVDMINGTQGLNLKFGGEIHERRTQRMAC